jgi:hypothetical protein
MNIGVEGLSCKEWRGWWTRSKGKLISLCILSTWLYSLYFFLCFLPKQAHFSKHSRQWCTGNGLVVPSSSHKREVAGSIPGWVHKNFSLTSSAVTSPTDVILWRLTPSTLCENPQSTEQHRTGQHCTEKDNMLVPPTWRTTAQPQQSTGEERIEAAKSSTLWERH